MKGKSHSGGWGEASLPIPHPDKTNPWIFLWRVKPWSVLVNYRHPSSETALYGSQRQWQPPRWISIAQKAKKHQYGEGLCIRECVGCVWWIGARSLSPVEYFWEKLWFGKINICYPSTLDHGAVFRHKKDEGNHVAPARWFVPLAEHFCSLTPKYWNTTEGGERAEDVGECSQFTRAFSCFTSV